jgi:hypothetical protein
VPLLLVAHYTPQTTSGPATMNEVQSNEMTTDFNRQQLIEEYVDRILDNMSTKDLMRIVGDQLEENLSTYSDEELITEVTEYYPELLESP